MSLIQQLKIYCSIFVKTVTPYYFCLILYHQYTRMVHGMQLPISGVSTTTNTNSVGINNLRVSNDIRRPIPYVIPKWCEQYFTKPPKNGRLQLTNVPTPLYRINFYNDKNEKSTSSPPSSSSSLSSSISTSVGAILNELNSTLYIKRDDCISGIEMNGNKLRKLEFLLADAIANECDCIITIGGIQSNHCRTTACTSQMLGLQSHLILRKSLTLNSNQTTESSNNNSNQNDDIGLIGNLLYDRMVGSHIYTCTSGEYGRIGSKELVSRLGQYLQHKYNITPYEIPVGGSNGVGTWGYINGVDELLQQWNSLAIPLHHVVVACGSGGTTAGIALGIALASSNHSNNIENPVQPTLVHAIGVCDDEDYFYHHIASIANEMGFTLPSDDSTKSTEEYIRQHLIIHQGKGRGYAQSTKDELDFIIQFAKDTGIVLDPVYTGKALYNFFQLVQSHPEQYENQNILFWHTGGGLGLFDKCNDLLDTLATHSSCQPLDIYGKGVGVDISK
jgi:D-cysteine desulfhydrase